MQKKFVNSQKSFNETQPDILGRRVLDGGEFFGGIFGGIFGEGNMVLKILGSIIFVSAIAWPFAHSKHDCPPRNQWKDSICPKAQKMEALMFLQFAIGVLISLIGKGCF